MFAFAGVSKFRPGLAGLHWRARSRNWGGMGGIRDEAEYTEVCKQIRVSGLRRFLAHAAIAKAQSSISEQESIQLSGVQT